MSPTKEFRSQLENIIKAEELLFHPTPGFGRYSKFLSHAIPHPAKMNTKLLEFLIKSFTREGETVLDPMCGSGSTGVIAALCGRNAVQVDIEEKFVKWCEEAKQKVESGPSLTTKGSIINVCGDARKLSELLTKADAVLTSPQNIGNLPHGKVDAVLTSPPFSETISKHGGGPCALRKDFKRGKSTDEARQYSQSEQNIGNLPRGKVDAIVTSPPYGEAQSGRGIIKEGYRGEKHSPTSLLGKRTYMPDKFESPDNISKLPMGNVDAVITSPPYAIDPKNVCHTKEGKTLQDYDEKRGFKPTTHPRIGYSPNEDNIGNLPFQPDAIITSPPYEGSLEGGSRHTKGGIASRDPALAQTGTYATRMSFGVPVGYSTSKDNIGNFKKETYLDAMLKVYSEMWKVLKPDGLAIIVIKPFIRNKQVVDLPYHTWLLLQKVGFKLTKLYKLRLKNPSFWRILYHKKHPTVPKINHEYILVVTKHGVSM